MTNRRTDRKRVMWINLFMAIAALVFVLGLLSLAVYPDATAYMGWLFSSSCFTVAFLMIRRKILRRFGK